MIDKSLEIRRLILSLSPLLFQGDLSSKYASRLINTFLYASKKTDDSLYRASALSNLGQLCTVLKYSLSKDLVEVTFLFFSLPFGERNVVVRVDSRRLEKLFVDLRISRSSTRSDSRLRAALSIARTIDLVNHSWRSIDVVLSIDQTSLSIGPG